MELAQPLRLAEQLGVAGLIGCDPSELNIRTTDTYRATETHTRYERGGEPV